MVYILIYKYTWGDVEISQVKRVQGRKGYEMLPSVPHSPVTCRARSAAQAGPGSLWHQE